MSSYYLAETGRPPLADIIGAAKAARASLVTLASAKALPHKMRDERSTSAAANPLEACDPRPSASLVLGLHNLRNQKVIYISSLAKTVHHSLPATN